jgi:bifunctional non-homologous end joining protein LigD
VAEPFFFQKQCPTHRPKWLRTARIWSDGRGDWMDYCTASDLASLVWLVNIGDLELHPFLAKAEDPLAPTMMVFDLDPGPGADLVLCSGVALKLRERLLEDGLASYPKVSGGKGMQLYVPLNAPHTFDATKGYSRSLAEELERAFPNNVTSNMRKELRKGRVFIDWSQNDDHKTTICVYSLRGQSRPWVSVPLHWDEVEDCAQRRDPGHLRFGPEDALHRVEEEGDLFAEVLVRQQRLPGARARGAGKPPGDA